MTIVKKFRFWLLLGVLAILLALPAASLASTGFLTPQPPFISLDPGVPSGSSVTAIISSGEARSSGGTSWRSVFRTSFACSATIIAR